MKLRLQVRQTPQNVYPWEHSGPVLRIGRDPACELSIQGEGSQSVSWNHGKVELGSTGAFFTDLGSSNGTYINGQRVEGRRPIHKGDLIELGQTGPKLQVAELDLIGAAADGAPPPTRFEPLPVLPAQMVRPAVAPVRAPVAPAPVVTSASRAADTTGSTTRVMLYKMQTSQKRNMMLVVGGLIAVSVIALLILFVLLPIVGVVVWKTAKSSKPDAVVQTEKPPAEAKGEDIYAMMMHSTVWVVVPIDQNRAGFGSGSLVDRDRRLVLTAQHVVAQKNDALVFFPYYQNDKLETNKRLYIDQRDRLSVHGRVVARDIPHDLALLQLDKLPDNVRALPIAEESIKAGQKVHTAGNPGGVEDAMWQYTEGTVRVVHDDVWQYAGDIYQRRACIVETQAPINPGDSGGAVVNDKGELIGVVAGTKGGAAGRSFCIDRREVAALLRSQ